MDRLSHVDRQTKKSSLKRKKTLVAYSFILPSLTGFLIFTFVPIIFSLILAFVNGIPEILLSLLGLRIFHICF